MNIWILALAMAAGFGFVSGEAFADRQRHGHSSAHPHRSHPPRAQQDHGRRHHQSHAPHRQRHHAHPHHRHHHHFRPPARIFVPSFAPRHFHHVPAPIFVAPPVAAPPPVVERPVVYPSLDSPYWYFCPDSRAYYPHVLECGSGWLQVVPQ